MNQEQEDSESPIEVLPLSSGNAQDDGKSQIEMSPLASDKANQGKFFFAVFFDKKLNSISYSQRRR